MFEPIRSVRIPIAPEELGKFFSVDGRGNRLTLGEYIKLSESGEIYQVEASRQPTTTETNMLKVGEMVFNGSEIDVLIDQYLESMADDEAFEIVGVGSFTKQQLREQMINRTSVGLQVIQMILDDRSFVAEQIKQGNYDTSSD